MDQHTRDAVLTACPRNVKKEMMKRFFSMLRVFGILLTEQMERTWIGTSSGIHSETVKTYVQHSTDASDDDLEDDHAVVREHRVLNFVIEMYFPCVSYSR